MSLHSPQHPEEEIRSENTFVQKSELGEDISQTKKQIDRVLQEPPEILPPLNVQNIHVSFVDTGRKITHRITKEKQEITLNQTKFSSPAEAKQVALEEVAYFSQIQKKIADNQDNVLRAKQRVSSTSSLEQVLRWKGIQDLMQQEPYLKNDFLQPQTFKNLDTEFIHACIIRIVTGEFPETLSVEVHRVCVTIPAKNGKTPLEHIALETQSLKSSLEMYEKYILPRREELRRLDREYRKTEGEGFRPAMDDKEDQEAMEENDIHQKVYPFFGGYYREKICHTFYTKTNHLLTIPVSSQKWLEEVPVGAEDMKRYKFQGEVEGTLPIRLPLPSKDGVPAFPLVETVQPVDVFELFRDEDGCFSLHVKKGKTIAKHTPYGFEFVFAVSQEKPILKQEEQESIMGVSQQLSTETIKFLEEVQSSPLSQRAKAGKVCSYVRKLLTYSTNGTLSEYYHKHPKGFFAGIEEKKEADCDVANTYFLVLLREIGIPCRQAQGYYVQKDPRFDFAALAGVGHAWSEVWTGHEWVRFDATPPGEREEGGESEEESEVREGDFGGGGDTEEQAEYTLEEIMEIYEKMDNTPKKTEAQMAAEVFQEKNGVSLKEWERVESYVRQVNALKIPKEQTIEQKNAQTLQEEWMKLFDLIYERREKKVEVFRGPVRQSEGDYMDDPTDAYIDLVAGEDDPMGYKLSDTKEKTSILVRNMEDDYILDLTGSMEGDKLEAQKQLVLASTYNIMQLNERLALTKYRENMKEPLILKSHMITFKGSTQVTLEHRREDPLDKKELVALECALEKTVSGGGNLLGALQAYESSVNPDLLQKIKNKKLTKILTVITDGGVDNKSEAIAVIQRLRSKGIIVQGIGFGSDAQDIRVICHDPKDPDAAVVLQDVKGAVLARHQMLVKRLKQI